MVLKVDGHQICIGSVLKHVLDNAEYSGVASDFWVLDIGGDVLVPNFFMALYQPEFRARTKAISCGRCHMTM